MKNLTRIALATGASVALLAGVSTMASAAPLGVNLETLKTSAPAASETVQWRRHRHHHHGVGIGLGAFGAGVVVGSALSNQGYYGDPYGYYGDTGYYGAPYGYYSAPTSSQPNYQDPADFAGR